MSYITTQKKTLALTMAVDLASQVPRIEAPVHFVMGEHDHLLDETRDYFDSLEAPLKRWHLIEGAGHVARGDAPEAFHGILFDEVLGRDRVATTRATG